MAIDPRGADLKRWLREDPGGSVGMLNLEGQSRDAVLLVRYPSREAFSPMVADPDHQQFTRFRTEALTEALLQPTTAW